MISVITCAVSVFVRMVIRFVTAVERIFHLWPLTLYALTIGILYHRHPFGPPWFLLSNIGGCLMALLTLYLIYRGIRNRVMPLRKREAQ